MSGELWQDEMIWSALIAEKPGSCAITMLLPALPLPADEVSDEPLVLPPAAVVEPVMSLALPEEPEDPDEPASAVVEDEPLPEVSDEPVVAEPEDPDEPASAVVEDEPVAAEPEEPEEPASAVVDDEPEPVVEFMALLLPEAALRPLR